MQRDTTEAVRAQRQQEHGRKLGLSLLLSALAMGYCSTVAAQVYDWVYRIDMPVRAGTIPVPTLRNSSDTALATFLSTQSTPAVKIPRPLSSATVTQFFDGATALSKVFVGFENPGTGGDALTATQFGTLVSQLNSSGSSGASVGHYGLDLYHPDATNPAPSSGLSDAAYLFSGANTGNPILFPGSPTFRTPASSSSTAPNIRSALFTLPLTRLSRVAQSTPSSDMIIPFVSRFNSIGSPLVNSEFEGIPAWETTDQLLSRGDYQALMTHYRMRGANGVIAHSPGVVGYTRASFIADTVAGWDLLGTIYPGEFSILNLESGGLEMGGFAWSGVFGSVAGGDVIATVLLSNLRDATIFVSLPSMFDGIDIEPFSSSARSVVSNGHKLLTFLLDDDLWKLQSAVEVFDLPGDGNSGIGIGSPLFPPVPLPPAVWLLGSSLVLLLRSRRRRRSTLMMVAR